MNNMGLTEMASGTPIALRGVLVDARIAGLLAETTLTQRYRNDGDENLELAYSFPLPVDGTLLSFAVVLGERRYQGEVIPRKEAEVAYEEAIGAGNSAFRLQEIKPGLYSATLGNVMAGEAVEITLTYAEPLAWNGKSIRYRLPTTIAPRYGERTGMQPWQRPVTSLEPEYPLSLVFRVEGVLAQSSIACPSHKISLRPATDSLAITLADGAVLDRDFILEIENESVTSLGVSASARDTHVAMLTLLPPPVAADEESARDIVIVLDCSGSMAGDSLEMAKEGVRLGLVKLSPRERFAVMGFGSRFSTFDEALLPANPKTIDMAHRFVQYLGDLGGTELATALERALAYSDGHPMDILLLTDGEVWGLEDATSKAKTLGVRIFTIGIGSAVAEDTVRTLADETGGSCELVSPSENMSTRIFRHFNRMRQPQMSQLEIRWPALPLWESRPEKACFAGDAYTVVAGFAEEVVLPVQVDFAFAGCDAVELTVPVASVGELADAVVRVAARQRMTQLEKSAQQDWAIRYQLVTDQTDYIVTVERSAAEKAVSLPDLQVVPQMLPAGWGGTSTVYECAASYGAADSPDVRYSMPVFCRKQSVDSCQLDSAPVILRRARSAAINALQSTSPPHPYLVFMTELKTRTKKKFFGSLPKSRKDLTPWLPEELEKLFDELICEGLAEKDVLLALYQALADHDGAVRLGVRFAAKVKAAIGTQVPQDALIARFRDLLNQLWVDHGSTPAPRPDRYDIPAFLRHQAD
jgi:Ca-activated chloride channel family protein